MEYERPAERASEEMHSSCEGPGRSPSGSCAAYWLVVVFSSMAPHWADSSLLPGCRLRTAQSHGSPPAQLPVCVPVCHSVVVQVCCDSIVLCHLFHETVTVILSGLLAPLAPSCWVKVGGACRPPFRIATLCSLSLRLRDLSKDCHLGRGLCPWPWQTSY